MHDPDRRALLGRLGKGGARLITRIGAAKTLAIGMAVEAAGLLLLTRVPTHAAYLGDIFPAFSVIGVGVGFAQVAMQIAAFAGIEPHEAGLAGGAIETSREMGGALGLAILVSIALSGATTGTQVFHRSVLAAAIFAAASAIVAVTFLRAAERPLPTVTADNEPADDAGANRQPSKGAQYDPH